jgi:hypothetical protein
LQNAPQCFDFVVDRLERSLAIKCIPEVAANHAAHGLIDGRGDGLEKRVSVNFRLLSVQEDPVLDRFRLHNCHDLPQTHVQLKGEYELYERQKKAVTKMVRIERGEVDFEEIEMNEQAMPGATGWSLIARASRMAKLRGGVIADAIGGEYSHCLVVYQTDLSDRHIIGLVEFRTDLFSHNLYHDTIEPQLVRP